MLALSFYLVTENFPSATTKPMSNDSHEYMYSEILGEIPKVPQTQEGLSLFLQALSIHKALFLAMFDYIFFWYE